MNRWHDRRREHWAQHRERLFEERFTPEQIRHMRWHLHAHRGKRGRLHLQIFRALVATGIASLLFAALIGLLFRDNDQERMPRFVQDVGAFMVENMPEEHTAFERELQRRSARLHAALTVWDRNGRKFAQSGRSLGPQHLAPGSENEWEHGQIRMRLPDGRVLAIAFENVQEAHHGAIAFCMIAFLLGTLMLGSWLASRRITRRLERLERGVTQFGDGRLDVRVDVRGRDEIASLAQAFNRSFDRIAGLLKQQTNMLQSASHELRSPLARVRMAMELATEPSLGTDERERLRVDATRDIEELDALIGDLLLAGRLADTELPKDTDRVELRAIVESEAARVTATYEATELAVAGNARMVRSLVRNLLENARRHGRDPIHASLSGDDAEVVLRVQDGGDGVPLEDRERIFEPFYRPVGHREGKDGGVGLGLSLVKNIAEHLGGSVRYCGEAEKSCFEVRLPRG